ncbi:lysophospholipid acyltransferase family protein [Paenibacillus sp. strain BS8-2]
MITPDRSERFITLFGLYNKRHLLPKHLHTLAVKGTIDAQSSGAPVLYIMNHSSWWDGMIVCHAITQLSAPGREHYMMMDEKQMAKFRFFRKLGAFSVDKTTLRGMAESLRYAEGLLKGGHNVWLFPQGDIRHLEARPLRLQSGAGYLLDRCGNAVVKPVTAYYALGAEQKAVATLCFGEEYSEDWAGMGRRSTTEKLRAVLESQLDEHRASSIVSDGAVMDGYRVILRGSGSTSERFDGFKRRMGRWFSFLGS